MRFPVGQYGSKTAALTAFNDFKTCYPDWKLTLTEVNRQVILTSHDFNVPPFTLSEEQFALGLENV